VVCDVNFAKFERYLKANILCVPDSIIKDLDDNAYEEQEALKERNVQKSQEEMELDREIAVLEKQLAVELEEGRSLKSSIAQINSKLRRGESKLQSVENLKEAMGSASGEFLFFCLCFSFQSFQDRSCLTL